LEPAPNPTENLAPLLLGLEESNDHYQHGAEENYAGRCSQEAKERVHLRQVYAGLTLSGLIAQISTAFDSVHIRSVRSWSEDECYGDISTIMLISLSRALAEEATGTRMTSLGLSDHPRCGYE